MGLGSKIRDPEKPVSYPESRVKKASQQLVCNCYSEPLQYDNL
jgi:hypothetical protein